MAISIKLNTSDDMLLDLNMDIQQRSPRLEYHIRHIKLTRRYAFILNDLLGYHFDNRKLSFAALGHDILKEHGLDPNIKFDKYPQDLNEYVRKNLDTLAKFGLDDYFNSDVSLHALSAGIYFNQNLHINDEEILYPIMFHSCPVVDIYEKLPFKTRTMVDIIMLADKLSSNQLRINEFPKPVRVDLDRVVFGTSGREFNYNTGLYLARLIAQGTEFHKESKNATEMYYKRLKDENPLISKVNNINKIGESKLWEKRKSQALMIH